MIYYSNAVYQVTKKDIFFSLHFDKLFVDNEIYMYNEATGQVSNSMRLFRTISS